jgi:predicted molibdopterin-dependent oxidoreductase YjgC
LGPAGVLEAVRKGRFGAVLVVNTDPCGGPLAAADLSATLFQVVFDLVPGPLAERAAVLLPASALAETAGTLMTNDGLVLPTAAVRRPLGGKTLFQAFGALADALGRSFPLAKPEHVWSEMGRLLEGLDGMSAAKLDLAGRRWPV